MIMNVIDNYPGYTLETAGQLTWAQYDLLMSRVQDKNEAVKQAQSSAGR